MDLDLTGIGITSRGKGADVCVLVRAKFTRAGVFPYETTQPAQLIAHGELRHPDEVFDPDSMDSLAYVPLTLEHDASSPRVGRVLGPIRRYGDFVGGYVELHGRSLIEKVLSGRLGELSCGYRSRSEHTPGEFEGKPYYVVQRRIRYTHVALLPPGGGRMGRECRLYLREAA